MRKYTRILAAGFSLLIFATSLFASGYVLKQKQHTDGMKIMGFTQPARDEIVTTWITADKIRSDQEKRSVYLFLDEKKMIVVDHEKKSWSELPLNLEQTLSTALEKTEGSEEDKQKLSAMTKGLMQMKITVTPTAETRKIGQWNCKKYIQTIETGMGPNQSIIWASEDIKLDYDVYSKLMAAIFSSQPGMGQMMSDMLKELKKIKGIPVLTETTAKMMNMEIRSTQELLEIKEQDIPKEIFSVPSGYKKKDVFAQ